MLEFPTSDTELLQIYQLMPIPMSKLQKIIDVLYGDGQTRETFPKYEMHTLKP